MFKLISTKIKEKILKLRDRKNVISDTNLVNNQEKPEKLNLGELKEFNECLNLIGNMRENMNKFDNSQLEKCINLIDRHINKYRNEYYIRHAEIRDCVRKLKNLKSDMQIKMVYGEEKKLLNTQEINELTECLNFIDIININMCTFDNNQIQKNINLVDKYINKYNNYYYMNYTLIRKTIRKLNNLKSDMQIKMFYENEFESEQEKVFLKCC